MQASVIIPTFHREKTFLKSLNSILRQSEKDFEIIIVDESRDNCIKDIIDKTKSDIKITYYKNPGKGQGQARNFGASVSKSSILIFIDSDVICTEHVVKEHLRFHRIGEKAVLGNIIFPPNKQIDFFTKNIDLGYYFSKINTNYVDFIKFITANISVNKKLFIDSGGFDDEFIHYGFEDLELGYRLFGDKKIIRFASNAICYHLNIRPLKEIRERNKNIAKASLIFFKKHPEYYNPYLLPVQRIIHTDLKEIKDYSKQNFKINLELEAENSVIEDLLKKTNINEVENIKEILIKNNLFFNTVTIYELAYLSKTCNISLLTTSDDIWAKYLFNYKFPVKRYSNSIFINNNKENTIVYYNKIPDLKNKKENYLPDFLISILKNHKKFYPYLISRVKAVISQKNLRK